MMDGRDQPHSRRSRFGRWTVVMIGLLLVVIALGAYLYFIGPTDGVSSMAPNPPSDSSPSAQGADQPVDVQVTKAVRRDLTYTITLPANIAPLYQTTLYAKVSGYLKWIGPDKGDTVKKDDILAVIDAPEVEEQYHQAVSDYKIKKLTHERLIRVWKESPDVIAKQDVDVAEAAYQGAKHSMVQREVLRAYTKVRAPYDGTITARFADPGALIQIATASATGAIPLFTIMDLHTVRAYANVPQDDSAWIVPGKTRASLTFGDAAGRSFTGTVTRTTMALDPSTRSLLIEVDLPNPDQALRPGTFAQVSLRLREINQTLVLPPQAVVSQAKTKSVFIVDQGRATSRPVQTGLSNGHWIEITSGLSGGEDVVVVGKQKLLEGAPVTASSFKLPDVASAQQKFERRSAGQESQDKQTTSTAPNQEPGSPALPTRAPLATQ